MDLKDCIKFANEHPDAYFATDDNGQPRVRGMMLWYADETGFYFQSQSVKALYRQLRKNNRVYKQHRRKALKGDEGNRTGRVC